MAQWGARGAGGATTDETAANLREALRIRLTIMRDHVHGFVSAEDIDRRDKYSEIEELLGDMRNASASLPPDAEAHVRSEVEQMQELLEELNTGIKGSERREVERRLHELLDQTQADLRGEKALPKDYCGSCYGAHPDPTHCCNTCNDVKHAYASRKWGVPDLASVEQCVRDSRRRMNRIEDGEGCNVYGTMLVARVSGSFHVAPASGARASRAGGRLPLAPVVELKDVAHFNVTHHIRRFSFGVDFPGQENPLDNLWTHSPSGAAVARYFLKVVPTTYEFLDATEVQSHQFSVTQYFKSLDITSAMLPSCGPRPPLAHT